MSWLYNRVVLPLFKKWIDADCEQYLEDNAMDFVQENYDPADWRD
jgi:hypothetical protein